MSIESVMPSNHLILCHPLLLLPSIFPRLRVFSNELTLHTGYPKCWNFSFSISPSKEYSGLISFSIDWFDLLAVQGTLKSLLFGPPLFLIIIYRFLTMSYRHIIKLANFLLSFLSTLLPPAADFKQHPFISPESS